ncbi:MAG: DoxX family protein [Flavobacteriales bacterium]|nr:DoxX family protein [Flavobacteriales bacterium]MCC6939202.1 DoxX family protein [Flavobacteriales bacterium]
MRYLKRLPDLLAAIILLQTLWFKFNAAPESVYIFSSIGAEPAGRIGSGVMELIAVVLLIISRTAWMGALLAAGIMAGAIVTHLTVIGIVVMDDGGTLFIMALIVTASCLWVLFRERDRIRSFVRERKRVFSNK